MFKAVTKSFRSNVLVGLFLTVPVVVTLWIFNLLFRLATNWLPQDFFPGLRTIGHGYLLRLLTLVAVLLFFCIVGVLTRNLLGRRLYQLGDRLLASIPILRNIYVSVRQISESLFTQRKTLFKEVVLLEYPRKGLFSIAFVTAEVPRKLASHVAPGRDDRSCVSLFIPTTPNPTSGVLILVPRAEVVPLNIPVTDALTFVMSAGAVAPGEQGQAHPLLLDRLEAWLKHDAESALTEADHADTQE